MRFSRAEQAHWQCSCSITGSVCHHVIRHHCSLSLALSHPPSLVLSCWTSLLKMPNCARHSSAVRCGQREWFFFSVCEGVCNLQHLMVRLERTGWFESCMLLIFKSPLNQNVKLLFFREYCNVYYKSFISAHFFFLIIIIYVLS